MARITPPTHGTTPGLRGAFTALVTPFTPDGTLDEVTFRRLVDRQIRLGIDGLVPVGTTGESPTLSAAERDRLIEITIEEVNARPSRTRIPVIAGTGSNDTRASIEATRRAAAMGADAALVNTAIAVASDPNKMAVAFKMAVEAGRAAFESGLAGQQETASPTSPLTAFLD